MDKITVTTICYIRRSTIKTGDEVLFVFKCSNGDINDGKYLGVGGHFEEGESPDECIIREIKEETGLDREMLRDLRLRGIVTFVNSKYEDEIIFVYDACLSDASAGLSDDADGEGVLTWVSLGDVWDLPVWEGDRKIFELLFGGSGFFKLKLEYDGDVLKSFKTE